MRCYEKTTCYTRSSEAKINHIILRKTVWPKWWNSLICLKSIFFRGICPQSTEKRKIEARRIPAVQLPLTWYIWRPNDQKRNFPFSKNSNSTIETRIGWPIVTWTHMHSLSGWDSHTSCLGKRYQKVATQLRSVVLRRVRLIRRRIETALKVWKEKNELRVSSTKRRLRRSSYWIWKAGTVNPS